MAPAIAVCASVTRVDVRLNGITGEGASQLSAAVLANANIEVFNEIPIKEMRANSLTELDLNEKSIGTEGGMVVAGLLPAMASLTSLIIYSNQLGDEGMGAIANALKDSTVSQLASLDVCNNKIGPKGAEALAAWLAVCASLTLLDVRHNPLDEEGEAVVRKAVEGRSGFKLEL